MQKPFTIATPRYYIRGPNGDHFDVFNKRTNAIIAAIALAVDFPGATFIVWKQVFNKDTQIFSINLNMSFSFTDITSIYEGFLSSFKKKNDKTKYWRKFDGNS